MMATTAELLAEAKSAYHRLQIGESAVEVRDATGESVRYTPANASRLKAYIAELEAENNGCGRVVPPLRPVWG
ncbi:gpW family head-tail joining protein [Mesorhizobium sp.]|uniref:gpW family head-tail joining protein n=1 Tax=Mesorhizobium sp. TaxID=1871066 RepID=UPI000FE6869C|nr:gpW family head-tail joining protein [Mesorhizobium sp.]RWF33708.1 MAG: phage tail protein [Mesorhizobium sp.]